MPEDSASVSSPVGRLNSTSDFNVTAIREFDAHRILQDDIPSYSFQLNGRDPCASLLVDCSEETWESMLETWEATHTHGHPPPDTLPDTRPRLAVNRAVLMTAGVGGWYRQTLEGSF